MGAIRTFFSRYLYFTLFVAYLAAIYLSRLIPLWVLPAGVAMAAIVASLAAFVFLLFSLRDRPGLRMAGFFALVVVGGMAYAAYTDRLASSSVLVPFAGEDVEAEGLVDSFPRLTENGMSFFVRIQRIETASFALRDRRGLGRVYVFVREGRELPISYQYRVRLRGSLSAARESRNQGGFSMREYLRPFGVEHEVVVPSPEFVEKAEPAGQWSRLLYGLKRKMVERAESMLSSPGRELFLGLLIGDSAIYFPRELKDTFRVAGLTHLLVVSGSQVSLLFLLVGLVFLRAEAPLTRAGRALNVAKYAAILGVIFTYAVLTGYEPSIRRAFVVIVLVLIAHYLYYETEGLNLLGQAGIILLLIHPYEAHSISFQLTFSATLGLILALKVFFPLVRHYPRSARWLLGILFCTAGAQVMVFPLLIRYFNQFSPWGLVSNLVAIPLASLILLLGIAFYLLSGIPVIGAAVAWIVQVLVDAMHSWAQLFSRMPGSDLHFVPLSGPVLAALLGLILLAFVYFGWGHNRTERMASLLCISLVVLLLALAGRSYQNGLPHFRILYVSSGAAGALVDESRRATLFATLPPSKDRQVSMLANCYWLLVRGGARGVSTLVITGGTQEDGLWEELPFRPRLVMDLVSGVVHSKDGNPALPSALGCYTAPEGAPGILSVSLTGTGKATILLPVSDRLPERLSAGMPAREDMGGCRILVVPGSSARSSLGVLGGFLDTHRLDAVILQGRGAVPQSLLHFTGRTGIFTQSEKKELMVRSDGEVRAFVGDGAGD